MIHSRVLKLQILSFKIYCACRCVSGDGELIFQWILVVCATTSMDHANELEDLPLSLSNPGRCLGAITESITWYCTGNGKRFSRFYWKWAWLVVFYSAAHICKLSTKICSFWKGTFGYYGCINGEQFNTAQKTLKNCTHKAWQTSLGVQTDKTWFYEWFFFFSTSWEHKKYTELRMGWVYKYWRICILVQFPRMCTGWILKG